MHCYDNLVLGKDKDIYYCCFTVDIYCQTTTFVLEGKLEYGSKTVNENFS